MATQRLDTTQYDDVLIDTDYDILRFMAQDGRVTPGYLSDKIGEKQPNTSKRLALLVDEGAVRKVSRALYELDDSVTVAANE